jgi:hypothetical protein
MMLKSVSQPFCRYMILICMLHVRRDMNHLNCITNTTFVDLATSRRDSNALELCFLCGPLMSDIFMRVLSVRVIPGNATEIN